MLFQFVFLGDRYDAKLHHSYLPISLFIYFRLSFKGKEHLFESRLYIITWNIQKMVILGSKEKLCSSLMESMDTLRKEDTLVDVSIKVNGRQIRAHKNVLASGSKYFFAYFAGPLKTEDRVAEVDLSTIALNANSVETVIDFLYIGQIDIHDENLEAIMKLTSFLLIPSLEKLCIEYIEQCCDLASFLKYYTLSVDYMIADAEWVAIRAIKQRFHDWFIYQQTTMELSPFYLQKLIEDYDIFQNCTETDWMSFLVDWVYTWQTEEHVELVCKILDGDVVPIYCNDSQGVGETQGNEQEQNVEDQSETQILTEEVAPINNDDTQCGDEPRSNDIKQHVECQTGRQIDYNGSQSSRETEQDDTQTPSNELRVNYEPGPLISSNDSQRDGEPQFDGKHEHVEDQIDSHKTKSGPQESRETEEDNAQISCNELYVNNESGQPIGLNYESGSPISHDDSQRDGEQQIDDKHKHVEDQTESHNDTFGSQESRETEQDDTQTPGEQRVINESGQPISPDNLHRDVGPQSDDEEQDDEDSCKVADPQKDNTVSQESSEELPDSCESRSENKQLSDGSPINNYDAQIETNTQWKQNDQHVDDNSVISNHCPGSVKIHSNTNTERYVTGPNLQRLGFDIQNSFKKIKNSLQSANGSRELLEKCNAIIESLNRRSIDSVPPEMPQASFQPRETNVEHVIMTIVPKKLVKDFHEKVNKFDDEEISPNSDDVIFDIYVYVPRTWTWYHFGEGTNFHKFKKIGKAELIPSYSLCMLDRLCFASEDESFVLHMYSFKHRFWIASTFEDLKNEFHNPGPGGRDMNNYDFRLLCMDGENLYIVLKLAYLDMLDSKEYKVKFKCYCSLYQASQIEVISETPYITEDPAIEFGQFDVVVSQGNKELLILAKGAKTHVFVADLLNKGSEMKHSIIEYDEEQPDLEYFWRRRCETRIFGDGEYASLIDELHVEERILYRSRKTELSANTRVERTAYEVIHTRFPKSYRESREPTYGKRKEPTAVKLSESVSDGTSLWLYLSDGKFDTSLTEVRPDESGYMEFIEHTPPPFTAITLLAAGKVKSEYLVGLKQIKNFIEEK